MESYTLYMSRGTHVLDAEAAESLLAAMDARAPYVTIDVDLLCDGFVRRGVRLATAQVVAVVPNLEGQDADVIPYAANVTPLWSAR